MERMLMKGMCAAVLLAAWTEGAVAVVTTDSASLEEAATLNLIPSDPEASGSGNIFDGSIGHGPRSVVPVFGASSSSAQLRRTMIETLDFVSNSFKAQYGPREWKKEHNGWNMDADVEKAKAEIMASEGISLKQYQSILRRVILSARDYHVSVAFASTERASLPLHIIGTNGHYFIGWIDRTKLPESSFPFHEGDELVLFGGQKTADAVKAIQSKLGGNVETTDRALATYFLTGRSASSLGEVPSGVIVIAVKPRGTEKILTHQLIWDYTPESVTEAKSFSRSHLLQTEGDLNFPFRWLNTMLAPVANTMGRIGNPHGIGNRESFLPPLGVKIWESDPADTFSAYIYKSGDGRLIGYVRIPSYMPDGADGAEGPKKALADFAKLVTRFEATTEALVIDQVNNPGGSVFYLYALVSMLSDQAIAAPRHRIAITQEDVVEAAQFLASSANRVNNDDDAKKALGMTAGGYPVNYQFYLHMVEFSRFIMNQWNAGNRLTDLTFLWGVDQINPSTAARFTKPILVLVNELDFSGGDFFPATLQDNKRAVIFGTRTAGAGGFIRPVQFPNQLGVRGFTVTGSIAERIDKNPIENLGVTPDINYSPTTADLAGGFPDYIKAVNTSMSSLLGGASLAPKK